MAIKSLTQPAVVLWTGGKDSSLALLKSQELGLSIKALVTFVPSQVNFLAHPIDFLKKQSETLQLPLCLFEIKSPFKQSYQKALRQIKKRFATQILITGDIAEIDGHPNWICESAEPLGFQVQMPLWKQNRFHILNELFRHKFKILISCTHHAYLAKKWLGKMMTPALLRDLKQLNQNEGIDPCGENGEYHTLVVDHPLFKQSLKIPNFSKNLHQQFHYIKFAQ